MNATTLASRAVIAAYAKKVLRPLEIIAIIILVIAVLGTAFLIAQASGWWWLLMIVVLAFGFFGSILWLIIRFTLDRLNPPQTPVQKKVVAKFVAQVESVSDTIGMTRFGLILRIIRDVMRRGERNVLTDLARDSRDLKGDFENVIKAFK